MGTLSKQTWMKKAAALAILPITALPLTGCGPEEAQTTGEDVFIDDEEESDDTLDDGSFNERFDQSFYDELNIYFGEDVTLTAQIEKVLSPHAFTITGADDASADPLLVVHAEELPPLEPQTPVVVGGPVREYFDLAAVEEELGEDLDDSLFENWQNEPFLLAERAETA